MSRPETRQALQNPPIPPTNATNAGALRSPQSESLRPSTPLAARVISRNLDVVGWSTCLGSCGDSPEPGLLRQPRPLLCMLRDNCLLVQANFYRHMNEIFLLRTSKHMHSISVWLASHTHVCRPNKVLMLQNYQSAPNTSLNESSRTCMKMHTSLVEYIRIIPRTHPSRTPA